MNVARQEDKINREDALNIRHCHGRLAMFKLLANRKPSLLTPRRNSTKESTAILIKDDIFAGTVEEKRGKK